MKLTQNWWNSPIVLTSILADVMLMLGLFLTVQNLNIVQVIGTSVIAIITVIAAANNPTNPVGFGPNIIEKGVTPKGGEG